MTTYSRCSQIKRRVSRSIRAAPAVFVCLAMGDLAANPLIARCLFISSYHAGYEWNDGIEAGLMRGLDNRCTVDRFYMDTKRHTSDDHGDAKARQALALIQRTVPDVVIAADDNASRYLVSRYLRNSDVPVVFCGVNWTVDEYQYPYGNATGMIEVAPIQPTLQVIEAVVPKPIRGTYLSSDVFTEHKDFLRYKQTFAASHVHIKGVFVRTLDEWRAAFIAAQSNDFVILGNNAGINDWDVVAAKRHVYQHARSFTVTNYDWMMPYAMFALTKLPEEQGEWAGQVAVAILDGTAPGAIPIVANRRWGVYSNPTLLEAAKVMVPSAILHNAIKVQSP